MDSTTANGFTAGLTRVLREYGLDWALTNSTLLENVLTDYSPETRALNRVAALAAHESVPGWLVSGAPGRVDEVVTQAVSRLVSQHAIDHGAAHDAVSAWALALGVADAGTRPTSAPVQPATQPQDRIQRRIENLLNDAEAAEIAQQWQVALDAYDDVLVLEPMHSEALALRAVVQRRMGNVPPAAKPRTVGRPAPPAPSTVKSVAKAAAKPATKAKSTLLSTPPPKASSRSTRAQPTEPSWRAGWMSACGEDAFGAWAAVTIAGVEHRFRYCAPGKFKMGSPTSEAGRDDDEGPRHQVTLTKGFWLGEAPVTQQQWEALVGSNPSRRRCADLPVESVSWLDCEAWMAHASVSVVGLNLRFPTEAEWEYSCRAGTTGVTYSGANDAVTLDAIAWYRANSKSRIHPPKQKEPNPWGLYDMIGNVWEWCADDRRIYRASAVLDPNGGAGASRAVRGCPFYADASNARAAHRSVTSFDNRYLSLGFRLARDE